MTVIQLSQTFQPYIQYIAVKNFVSRDFAEYPVFSTQLPHEFVFYTSRRTEG